MPVEDYAREIRALALSDGDRDRYRLALQTMEGADLPWGVIAVVPDDQPGARPPHAYTFGALDAVGFELLVVGLPLDAAGHMLNRVLYRLTRGGTILLGDEYDDVLEPPHTAVVCPIPADRWNELPADVARVWHHVRRGRPQTATPLAQVVYPDADMHWPWERAYVMPTQPYLGDPGVDPRDRGWLRDHAPGGGATAN